MATQPMHHQRPQTLETSPQPWRRAHKARVSKALRKEAVCWHGGRRRRFPPSLSPFAVRFQTESGLHCHCSLVCRRRRHPRRAQTVKSARPQSCSSSRSLARSLDVGIELDSHSARPPPKSAGSYELGTTTTVMQHRLCCGAFAPIPYTHFRPRSQPWSFRDGWREAGRKERTKGGKALGSSRQQGTE